MGGTTGNPISFDWLPLYDAQGKPNNSMVAVYSVPHNTVCEKSLENQSDKVELRESGLIIR